jgi:hypothetical protein
MASSVTPKQIYQALTAAGASTIQAIGIMANMIAESGLDPESVNPSDPNGGSFGLVQQNGALYSGLVTGNAADDMNAQIKVLAQNGGIAAATGTTGAAAAGNFAANYERCVGCQAGGAQYNQRVANAATVEGWISSGKWPASAGSATAAAGGTGGGATSNSTDPTCAWGFSGSLVVTSVNICVVKKTTLRHVVGGLLLGGGGVIALVGAAILAASAFRSSGAAKAVGQVAQVAPAPVRVVVRSATARSSTARPRRSRSSGP